jgi:glycine dehydrogenase subunit 1
MPFNPHTDSVVRAMLACIGAARIEDLFDEIPGELRVRGLEHARRFSWQRTGETFLAGYERFS